MEDVLLMLLAGLAELLVEVVLQLVSGAIAAVAVRLFRDPTGEPALINSSVATLGYFLLGSFLGGASLRLFPHPLFRPSKLHGISLLLSPIITGLVIAQVGTMLRRKDEREVGIETFKYGFTFALGMALVRLICSR